MELTRESKIKCRLAEHLDAVKDKHKEWVGLFLQGSQNYNLDYDGSDIDSKLSIGDHCLAAQRHIWQTEGYTRELEIAALLHDIGKEFTKGFVNSKGEPSEVAHYYEHHHVSAYDSLFYVPPDVDRLHVAALIQWHMRPFEIEKSPHPDRAYEKFNDLVGERVYNDVMALHAADLAAH